MGAWRSGAWLGGCCESTRKPTCHSSNFFNKTFAPLIAGGTSQTELQIRKPKAENQNPIIMPKWIEICLLLPSNTANRKLLWAKARGYSLEWFEWCSLPALRLSLSRCPDHAPAAWSSRQMLCSHCVSYRFALRAIHTDTHMETEPAFRLSTSHASFMLSSSFRQLLEYANSQRGAASWQSTSDCSLTATCAPAATLKCIQ